MTDLNDVQKQARSLPLERRQQILLNFPEVQLHVLLRELFRSMQPDYKVEVTHGTTEFGKDLVLVKRDKITTDVIAVVVKRGDISGQTLGDVDSIVDGVKSILTGQGEKRIREIESQVEQALMHAAELPTSFAKLQANKVSVVLAGNLSGNARVRLEKEIPHGGVIYDIERLTELFTDFYPQAFFDGTAIDFIQMKMQLLETKNWLIKSHKTLSEYFVEPEVSPVSDLDFADDDETQLAFKSKVLSFAKLRELSSNNSKVILVGDPGTGKSAALAKLSIDFLKTAFRKASKAEPAKKAIGIPITVTAREVLNAESGTNLFINSCEKSEIRHRFEAQVLLIDGLDEVAPELRQDVINRASKFADELSCSVIITSRKVDIISVTPSGFQKFELRPFQLKQALKLFTNLLQDEQHIDALKEGLERIKGQIPIIPLSLVLLMELVEENGEIPSSLTELYDRFVDFVLGRDDKKKGISVLYEYIIKKKFLASLAYTQFLSKENLEISRVDFDDYFHVYAKQFGFKDTLLSQFINEIERGGVIKIGDNTVEFVHRSFLDYFAAFHLYDQRDEMEKVPEHITSLWYSGLWQEVAFFFVGLKRDVGGSLLNRVLDKQVGDTSDMLAKFMVGRLLQAGWHSPSSTKSEGIKRGFSLAPELKTEILSQTEQHRHEFPKILSDFFVFRFSIIAYRSGFLKDELKAFYKELHESKNSEVLRIMLPLLWVIKPFLSENELRTAIDEALSVVAMLPPAAVEEEAGALLILRNIEENNTSLTHTIDKKVSRFSRRYPEAFRAILPAPKNGFRRKNS